MAGKMIRTPTADPALIEYFRTTFPCFACGTREDLEVHHVKTRGSGGGDDVWNLLTLCVKHHKTGNLAWHKSPSKFLEAFPHVWEYLQKQGWEMLNGKLFNKKNFEDMVVLKQKEFGKNRRC